MNNRIEQKSKELVEQFIPFVRWKMGQEDYIEKAKQCAIICCQYIINANPHSNPLNTDVHSTMEYWQQVKNHIENNL